MADGTDVQAAGSHSATLCPLGGYAIESDRQRIAGLDENVKTLPMTCTKTYSFRLAFNVGISIALIQMIYGAQGQLDALGLHLGKAYLATRREAKTVRCLEA